MVFKMHIELVNSYSTNIQDILELASNENACFISSWDKNDYILNIDASLIEKSIRQQNHKNMYIMSKDMASLKDRISLYLNDHGLDISRDYMTIVANGTSAAFISILQVFKTNAVNFLCIGPIYFTYMHLINIFKKKLYYCNIDLFSDININYNILKKELKDNDIHCIILIQPFFGSGIELSDFELRRIISLCEEQEVYLLIDYVYGSASWITTSHIHNPRLIQLVTASKYCILYESISKRIFLNGMKNSVVFSSPKIISDINVDSEICLGSISYIQESLLHSIYSPTYLEKVNHFITDALTYASENYNLICTLILGTDIKISKSTSGYYTLMAIPKKYFKSVEDREIANELYQNTGVVTIPHSRYYYNLMDYYCFRINLVLKKDELFEAIHAILQMCSNCRNFL